MKKMIIPLLGFLFLHVPYTQPRFSDGFIVGGLAGFTTGLVTSAIASQYYQPDIVFVEPSPFYPSPLREHIVYVPQREHVVYVPQVSYPISYPTYVPVVETRIKRHYTKVRRKPRARRKYHQPSRSTVTQRSTRQLVIKEEMKVALK